MQFVGFVHCIAQCRALSYHAIAPNATSICKLIHWHRAHKHTHTLVVLHPEPSSQWINNKKKYIKCWWTYWVVIGISHARMETTIFHLASVHSWHMVYACSPPLESNKSVNAFSRALFTANHCAGVLSIIDTSSWFVTVSCTVYAVRSMCATRPNHMHDARIH